MSYNIEAMVEAHDDGWYLVISINGQRQEPPNCPPNFAPVGPFATERAAIAVADELIASLASARPQ